MLTGNTQKYEWGQCDINEDGYRDLILQEKEASVNGLKQIVFVFSCNPNDECISRRIMEYTY